MLHNCQASTNRLAMNRRTTAKRIAVGRLSFNTVAELLVDAGLVCAAWYNGHVRRALVVVLAFAAVLALSQVRLSKGEPLPSPKPGLIFYWK